jgi:glycosyltransferase involved in cell wall biosynthesis
MRVLIHTESFHPIVGGLEVWAAEMGQALMGRGHVVEVLTGRHGSSWPPTDVVAGLPVTRLDWRGAITASSPAAFLEIVGAVRNLLQRFRPDVTLFNGIGPGALAYFRAEREQGPPLVVVPQASLAGQPSGHGTVIRRSLQRADRIVAPASSVLDEVLAIAPELAARARVILDSHGRDEPSPSPIAWDPPRLLCFGRLERNKGFDVALDAFAALVHRHDGLQLTIAGAGSAHGDLVAHARMLGVSDHVTFPGLVSDAEAGRLRRAACIVLMPSRSEGFGLVAMEGARAGRPVVATRITGLRDVVEDGVTGLLVPPDDVSALDAAVERLLSDHALAEQLGATAAKRAAERFAWGPIVDAWEQVLLEAAAR